MNDGRFSSGGNGTRPHPPRELTVAEAAAAYARRGWPPVPLPYRSKNPGRPGWQNLRITESQVPNYFDGSRQNVGILNGAPSGLVDVDHDCAESLSIGPRYLPPTGMIFGRRSTPVSHCVYAIPGEPPATRQFHDVAEAGGEGAMLIEFRSTGSQTVFPPSTHPGGEPISFIEGASEPEEVDGPFLLAMVSKVAAGCILARHGRDAGSRHHFRNALAGGLTRAGWAVEDVAEFLHAVCASAGHEDLDDADTAARTAHERLAAGQPCTGWNRLAALIGRNGRTVVAKATEWLGITREPNIGEAEEGAAVAAEAAAADEGDMRPVPLGELWDSDPDLREPIIDGVLRRGQVGNLISTSKSYKTYLVFALAIGTSQGRPWLDCFPTTRGTVLLIDLELQRPDITRRTHDIAQAMHVPLREAACGVQVLSLRGRNATIDQLERLLLRIPPRTYSLVIIDPLYKTYPPSFDENSNPQMTALYRRFERLAEHLDAALLVVHHASKGSQSDKSVVDVGAGAGAQARSPDAHIVIRPHEAEDAVVFEARVRSFRPPEPLVLVWRNPLWERDLALDPAALKTGRKARNADKPQPQPKAPKKVWTPESFAAEFVGADPQPKDVLLSRAARAEGLSLRAATGLLAEAAQAGLVHRHSFPGDNRAWFASREQTLLETSVCVAHVPPTPPVCGDTAPGAGTRTTHKRAKRKGARR